MAEKRTIELEIKDNTKTLKQQYKEAVVELQNIAAAYGETSMEAAQAAKRAAELKDQIEDTNDLLQSYKGEGAFIAMGKAMSSVASGFSAIEGGLGIVGVESENVQKTMLKVQSAMALAQGLEGLEDAGRSFKQLGSIATNVFKNMTAAGKAFTITGIGIAITAVSYLMGAFDGLTTSVTKVSEAEKTRAQIQANANEIQQATIENSAKELSALDSLSNTINDESLSRKEKNRAIKDLQTQYPDLLKNVKGEKLSIQELNKVIALNIKLSESRARVSAAESLRAKKYQDILQDEMKLNDLRNVQSQILLYNKRREAGISDEQQDRLFAEIKANKALQDSYLGTQDAVFGNGKALQELINQSQKSINSTKQEIKAIDGITEADKKLIQQTEEKHKVYETDAEAEAKALEKKKKANEDAEAKRKANIEATKAAQKKTQEDLKKHNEQLLNEEEANAEAIRRAKMSARELELSDIQDEYFTKIEQAKQLGEKGTELVIKLQEEELQKKKEINKKYDDEALAKQKAQNDAMRAIDEQETQNYITEQEIKISLLKDGLEKELAVRKLAYDQEQIELQKRLDDNLITEAQFLELSKTNNRNYEKDIAETRDKYDKENQARKRAELERNVEFVKQGLTIIQDLTDLFGKKGVESARKAFKVKKAAQMASALIDTYMNATAAYGSQFLPIPDPSSPVRGGIAAGLAVAAGLVNVAKIGAQKFEGGGSSGGGGGGGVSGGSLSAGGGMQAPNFNVVGNNGLNQLAQLQQQPTQAYVVSGEVTSAQSLDRNRIQNATL